MVSLSAVWPSKGLESMAVHLLEPGCMYMADGNFRLTPELFLCPELAQGRDCRAARPWGSPTACISALCPSSVQGPVVAGWNLSAASILAAVSCEKQLRSCVILWASSPQCPAGILLLWASSCQGQLEFGSCELPPHSWQGQPSFQRDDFSPSRRCGFVYGEMNLPRIEPQDFSCGSTLPKFTEPLTLSGYSSAGPIDTSSTPVRDEGFVWLVT